MTDKLDQDIAEFDRVVRPLFGRPVTEGSAVPSRTREHDAKHRGPIQDESQFADEIDPAGAREIEATVRRMNE